jgi:hypothetical protein
MVDWNSRHPDIDARLQRIAFGVKAQDRRVLSDSVFEQDHINVVMKVLFPLTRWFLPFQFAGEQVRIRSRRLLFAQESYARRSECDSPCKLEHELFVGPEILRERQSLRFYSAVTDRHALKPNESFLQLKSD